MATVTRGLIQRGDLALYDGKNPTASRPDATGGTRTGLVVGNTVDVLQVYGAGTSRTRGTIATATQRIGSTSVSLQFSPGTWTIDDDLTIPSNFTCHVPRGCLFEVASGKTLTFSGPIIADSDTFSSGSGTAALSSDSIVNGKPWYAKTAAETSASVTPSSLWFSEEYIRVKRYGAIGDGSTDDTDAAQAAMDVAAEYGGAKIVFEHGNFLLNTVTIDRGDVEIIGDGADITAHTSIPANGAIFLSLAGGASAVTNQAIIDAVYGASVHSVRTVEPNGLINNRISGLRLLAGSNINAIKGIWATGWHIGTVLENITAYGFEDASIALNGCFSFCVRNCDLRGGSGNGVGLELAKTGNGIVGASTVQCNAINIIGVQSGRDNDIGFRWGEGLGGIITGCTFQENTVTATAVIQDCVGFSYVGNYHEFSAGVGLILGTDAASPFAEGFVIGNLFQVSTGSDGAIKLLSARRSVIGPNHIDGPVSVQYITPAAYAASQLVANRIVAQEDTSVYIDESAGGIIDRSQLIELGTASDQTRGVHNFRSVRRHGRVVTPVVTAAEITADQNDYDVGTNSTFVRLSSDASRTITGFTGIEDGRELKVINVGANNIVLANESVSSTVGLRIKTTSGSDLTLAQHQHAHLYYDITSDRWRVLSTNGT